MMKKTRLGWYKYHRKRHADVAKGKVESKYASICEGHMELLSLLHNRLNVALNERSIFRKIFFLEDDQISEIRSEIYSAEEALRRVSISIDEEKQLAERQGIERYEIERSLRRSERVLLDEKRIVMNNLRRERYIEYSLSVRANQSAIRKIRIGHEDPKSTGIVSCFYCKHRVRTSEVHLDHRKPVAMGGKNTRRNTVLACPTCNLKKGKLNERQFIIKYKLQDVSVLDAAPGAPRSVQDARTFWQAWQALLTRPRRS